ncbi:tetratricopeptide repeat protein [Streptomyces sp. NPDC090445]|uniref:tetratricopeptide repeat protein n=1 Tax=Streptomyces sp. NPDC090445 TaxID=3365963 RepID=UPI0038072F1C
MTERTGCTDTEQKEGPVRLHASADAEDEALVGALLVEGGLHRARGDLEQAEHVLRQALALAGRPAQSGGQAARLLARAQCGLAAVYRLRGRYRRAQALLRTALERAEGDPASDGLPELADLLNELAVTCKYTGEFDEAERLYRRVWAVLVEAGGPAHPELATVWHNLAGLAHARGDFAAAEPPARRSVALSERTLGPDHPAVAADRAALAAILDGLGRREEAERLLREALAVFGRVLGPGHHETAVTCHNLACLAYRRGRLAEAEQLFRRALAVKETVLGPDHPELAVTLHNLALVVEDRGRRSEALPLVRRAVAVLEGAVSPGHPLLSACRARASRTGGIPDSPPIADQDRP